MRPTMRARGAAESNRGRAERHKVTLVPAANTGRVPVLEIAVPDALALSARLQRGDPPVHLSERHAARGVLTLDPQVLLPEHDAPLAEALRAASS